jgi:hypothetical protein
MSARALPTKAVTQTGEPSGLLDRQALDMAAYRLDEHQLRQLREDGSRPRALRGGFGQAELDRGGEPLRPGAVAHVHDHDARERREHRIEQGGVAREVAAHHPRDGAIATVAHLRHVVQGSVYGEALPRP